jgi:hypothetical protein
MGQFEEKRKRSRKQIPAFGKGHAYGGQASSAVRDADEFGMTTLERRRKAKKKNKGWRP